MMEKKKRCRFEKVSPGLRVGRNARPVSIWVRTSVLVVFLAPILWFALANYWYRETRPTELGIKKYLWCHGVFGAVVQVAYSPNGGVRRCVVHTEELENDAGIIGGITPLTEYIGECTAFDVQKVVPCKGLRVLSVGGRLLNAERLAEFPDLQYVRGKIDRPFEDERLKRRVLSPGWHLTIHVTRENLGSLLQSDNTEGYEIFLTKVLLNSLDEATLAKLKAKKFKSINHCACRPSCFWR